jgi:hypothetical protein
MIFPIFLNRIFRTLTFLTHMVKFSSAMLLAKLRLCVPSIFVPREVSTD